MTFRIFLVSVLWAVLCAPSLRGGDLSKYRGFQFDMSVVAAAKQAKVELSDIKAIQQRPAILQDLVWHPQRTTAQESDSVREVVLSFYNGQLCRMAVTYERYKTEGLTAEDMIDAISENYGAATRPVAEILFPSIFNENVKVIARWEDSQYSFNLVRSSYQSGFGLVAFSKRLDGLAQAAILESARLDKEEAPQKEAALRSKLEKESGVQQEIARLMNKANFRP